MERITIIYGTTEGQTAKVSEHLRALFTALGFVATTHCAADLDEGVDLDRVAAVVVGASVHEGRHQRYLRKWVKRHAERLNTLPTAFFSLSLAAASHDPAERAEAEATIDHFQEETGLQPTARLSVAGALRYTQYSWLKRVVMKRIATKEQGETDTSKDHEYTDWLALDAWAEAFVRDLPDTASTPEQSNP